MNNLKWQIIEYFSISKDFFLSFKNKFYSILRRKPETFVFCIGCPKTGNTSLYKALRILGLKVAHMPYWRVYRWKSLDDYLDKIRNSYFDAYIDFPLGEDDLYKYLKKAFPNAKFILTIRDNDSFVRSFFNFYRGSDWFKGLNDPDKKDKVYEWFDGRNKEIISFFKGDGDFLLLDIINGDGWDKLCDFLGKPVPNTVFPHKNKSRYTKDS